jgi:predicted MFS family arabinose efflux permease
MSTNVPHDLYGRNNRHRQPRGFSPLVMIGGIAALTVPLGLVGDRQWLCLALVPSGMLCAPALSATVDAVSRWVPTAARGEAMGLHGTALTLGLAVSGPVTGLIIDGWGTDWAFAVAGLGSLLMVALAVPFWRYGLRHHPIAEGALTVPS